MKKFRVLMLYPNGVLMNPVPISIGLFTAILRENGFDVDLFDTTLYPESDNDGSDANKQRNLQVKPFDWSTRGVELKTTRMEDDLLEKVRSFQPDLIAISILECTYNRAREMLDALEHLDIPVLAGGVFPTFASRLIFRNHKRVKMVCVGEGENAFLEVCKRMSAGLDCSDIKNIHFRKDSGEIIENPYGPLVDINELPIPDYSLFDWERFMRPMGGKVYVNIPMETNRGCPYVCTFCNSPSTLKVYKERGQNFFRKKTAATIIKELEFLVNRWKGEYVYFTSDTFLLHNPDEFDDFVEGYRKIRLPFWIQTRPETVSEYNMKKLKEIGCHRLSLGLEHGNEEFRINVLKKTFDEDVMIASSRIIADAGIPLTVNNMIGFPDETRELIFDTIELNRKLVSESVNCAVFAPFHGTPLHQYCLEKGYIDDDLILGSLNVSIPLKTPHLSEDTIKGIRRTFLLYIRMPKEYWPRIRIAERFDEEGDRMFEELRKVYEDKYSPYSLERTAAESC